MTTEKLSERIRFEAGWGYSDGPTNRLVDDARALEQALEKARAELQAVKGERDAARLAALRECMVLARLDTFEEIEDGIQALIRDAETEVGT